MDIRGKKKKTQKENSTHNTVTMTSKRLYIPYITDERKESLGKVQNRK